MRKLPDTAPTRPSKPCSDPAEAGPPARKPNGQFQRGTSGNPNGRAPGSRNYASLHFSTLLVRDILQAHAEKLTQAAIDLALEGNPLALKLCLDRISPSPQARTVQVDLPAPAAASQGKRNAKPKFNASGDANPNAPVQNLLNQHTAVLQAVASGELTPEEGERLSHIVDGQRRTWESTLLADRITALEDRADELKQSAGKLPKVTWVDPWDRPDYQDPDDETDSKPGEDNDPNADEPEGRDKEREGQDADEDSQ